MGRVIAAALAGALLTSGILMGMSMKTTVYISWYTGSVVAVRHGVFTEMCRIEEECEFPSGEYVVEYVR
ncbi:hypothetical protein ACR77U_13455 [Enterococcus faecium]|uniref:hypothetical protein n=1 Tax=Enterococcus faecium TaxID=1352 RepID=UPI003DA33ADF